MPGGVIPDDDQDLLALLGDLPREPVQELDCDICQRPPCLRDLPRQLSEREYTAGLSPPRRFYAPIKYAYPYWGRSATTLRPHPPGARPPQHPPPPLPSASTCRTWARAASAASSASSSRSVAGRSGHLSQTASPAQSA